MTDKFWGLGEKTPNRKALQAGDKVAFYIGNPVKAFAGTATIVGETFRLTPEQLNALSHDNEFLKPEFGVHLSDIDTWTQPRAVGALIDALSFIENKLAWGVYLQGGVRWIDEEDYFVINGNRNLDLVEQIKSAKDLENQAEFALESHLEEFIFANWTSIDFRSKLRLYAVDGQNGRQFPAGSWSIDFLCLDEATNDFVIVELKRGKSSDAAVGQMARYMSWVRENLATDGMGVRGIIIAHSADDALRYAVKAVPKVEVLTYSVTFELSSLG